MKKAIASLGTAAFVAMIAGRGIIIDSQMYSVEKRAEKLEEELLAE